VREDDADWEKYRLVVVQRLNLQRSIEQFSNVQRLKLQRSNEQFLNEQRLNLQSLNEEFSNEPRLNLQSGDMTAITWV
jgi:hypothetical protein